MNLYVRHFLLNKSVFKKLKNNKNPSLRKKLDLYFKLHMAKV